MTGTLRRAALGGLLAVAGAVGLAGPAAAAPPSITFTAPGPGQQIESEDPTVTALVSHSQGLSGQITMRVKQLESSRPDITASTPAAASPQSVSFPLNLPYNGRYQVTVTATSQPGFLTGAETASQGLTFAVAAPPAVPTGIKTAVDATSRAVTVSWKKNTEPDLLFYVVQRAKGAGNDFSVLGRATVADAKFVDSSTADAGGDYRYQVVAVRSGIAAGEGVSSDPSALGGDATAKVPDPPPPPTTAPAAGGTGTGAGAGAGSSGSAIPAGSPGALTTSGTVDLSGFNNLQTEARRSVVPRAPSVPDPGFQNTLPFDATGSPDAVGLPEGAELGEEAAAGDYRELGADEESDTNHRSLVFLAAGLLATTLLMHVQWLKGEVNKVPLEAVSPEGAAPVSRPERLVPVATRAGRAASTRRLSVTRPREKV